ncbi:16S rRNA (cytosine(967)-C(5))-methyltransferase RsmB [Thermosulfurimonas sp. F29]|uniref:16S rRNA (cytosine(967)-C(5))-methyltransferase RsmB n=1 Tax=Thermosulfurimonas sp. F29 TaxID=2867247 RepID=UPI001C82FC02|nr:16S rRNA (cytosine(967)-C(5))-methyltransferase RsmB [Thermosulfurimonas sp. F29]MBX6422420.1 16S rRNA (cytosine(967)-C(5))-methyltransferase RsmB [Thermosulfurimonas sp. F29]
MPKLPRRNPRAMALKTLIRWERGKPLLDEILSEVLVKSVLPDPRDRALCGELVNGVVRHLYYLDYVISRFAEEPLDKMDPQVRNLLRLSAYQLLFTRIPERAAVAEAVKLIKRGRGKWVVSFVNAVLRRIAGVRNHPPEPPREMNPVAYLSVRYSYPEWMVERWLSRFGEEETERLLAAGNEKPPLVVRVNTLRVTRDQLLLYLRSEIPEAEACRYSPEGIVLRGFRGRITDLRAFRVGWLQVQDEASQLVSYLVSPRPGERVLDACAGVGGKTTHLAQLMRNTGRIYAYDLYDWRLERLRENAARLGVNNVETVTGDVLRSVRTLGGNFFDRILVDAPCTGTGVIRRHPDIKWARRPEDLVEVPKKQLALLEGLVEVLKPGGVLVYATCSLEPEENEEVVAQFLSSHSEFEIEDPRKVLPEPARDLVDENGFLHTYPHRHGLDGFFGVRLRKRR